MYTHKDRKAMCPTVHHIPRDRSKCVCDHRFPMILTHSIHTEKFCRVLPDTPLDTSVSKLLGSKCIGVYASGIYFLMS